VANDYALPSRTAIGRRRPSSPGCGASVRAAIEAAGAKLLYLPPYSPDFNPIENAFSKLKALLRTAAERTVEGLWAAIGRCLDRFTPRECANYFAAAGYEPT
jgi:transposase